MLTASDLRALKSTASLSWNGRALPWTECPQDAEGSCGGALFVMARRQVSPFARQILRLR